MNAFGIDLGSSNIKIYNGCDNTHFMEKNMIAIKGRDTLFAYGDSAFVKSHYLLKEGFYDYVGSDMHGLNNFKRFVPEIRLKSQEMDELQRLLDNNKTLFN